MSDVTRRFGRGAGWIYGYRWIERLLDFLAVVLLARLLTPEDFGVVAIAASWVTIVEGLSDFDVGKALIRSRDDERPLFDTAWTLSALRGLVAAAVIALLSPFAGDPRLVRVLYVLALVPLINGLANPRFVLYERALDYSKLATVTVAAKLASVALMIYVALAYRSYWALVLGFLVASVATSLLTYALRPYRPRPSLKRFADIFAFSGWLSLTRMVTTLSMETDKIIVGRLLGVADAGLYFMTQRIGVLPTRELVSPLQRILFPSFAEIADDRARVRAAARESINVLGSLGLPAGVGFALVASDFVPLVLGPGWQPIVPLLAILTPFLGLRATLSMALPCVMALGRTRLLFAVSGVYALVHLPAFIAGTALYGLPGAIGSIVLAGLLYTWLNGWMLRRTLGITWVEISAQLARPALGVAVMVPAAMAVGRLPLFGPAADWLRLIAQATTGAVAFASVLVVLWLLQGRPEGIEYRLSRLRSR